MNSIRLFKKAKLALMSLQPRHYGVFSHMKRTGQVLTYLGSGRAIKVALLNVSLKSTKCISSCNFMQTNHSYSPFDEKDNEKMRKIFDDEEFQNILKDFANDFGVENEDDELLEDIRKDIDKAEENNLADEHPSNKSASAADLSINKYKEFSDTDCTVILDYNEQYCSEKYDPFEETEQTFHINQESRTKNSYHDLKRGITGVFDLHDLVMVLKNENMQDVTAISIPKERHYADFIVLATAKSPRHSYAVTELIVKLYKKIKSSADRFLEVEGKKVSNWKAIDMGNIVLHIFLEETRLLYDIESLWLFDSEYDSGGNMPGDPMFDVLQEQVAYFNSLNQSQSSELPKDIS